MSKFIFVERPLSYSLKVQMPAYESTILLWYRSKVVSDLHANELKYKYLRNIAMWTETNGNIFNARNARSLLTTLVAGFILI